MVVSDGILTHSILAILSVLVRSNYLNFIQI